MDGEPAPAEDDVTMPRRRHALDLAAQLASTSCKRSLPPEVLFETQCTGVVPADFEPHIGSLLDKAPLSLLGKVAEQISADAMLSAGRVWTNMQGLAVQLGLTRDISVPAMLKEYQDKASEDVKAGRRSSHSLWAFQPGDLAGYTLTPSPTSEYDKPRRRLVMPSNTPFSACFVGSWTLVDGCKGETARLPVNRSVTESAT